MSWGFVDMENKTLIYKYLYQIFTKLYLMIVFLKKTTF